MSASSDQAALIRLAAEHAEQNLERVRAVMTLIYLHIGEGRQVDADGRDTWVRVLEWLSDVVLGIETNLSRSLGHDEIVALSRRVKQ